MNFPTIGLGSINIGGRWLQQADVPAKALYSSPIGAIRPYYITKNPVGKLGYVGGTGGKLQCDLCADDAGIPGHVLDTGHVVDDHQFPEWINNGGFPLILFPRAPLAVAGQWYHFKFTNVDPDPVHNYSTVDFLISKVTLNPDPFHKVLISATGTPWKTATTKDSLGNVHEMMASPFGIFYANGLKQGNGGYQLAPDGSTLVGDAYGFGGL